MNRNCRKAIFDGSITRKREMCGAENLSRQQNNIRKKRSIHNMKHINREAVELVEKCV